MKFERKLRYHYKLLGVKDVGEKCIIRKHKNLPIRAVHVPNIFNPEPNIDFILQK